MKRMLRVLTAAALALLTAATLCLVPAAAEVPAGAGADLPFPVGAAFHITDTYRKYPEEQLLLAARMGVKIVRIDMSIADLAMADYLDQYIALGRAYGLDFMGYVASVEQAEIVAKRYGKEIKYFQILNENDAVGLAYGDGTSKEMYNRKKMMEIVQTAKDISAVLRKYAPQSTLIINMTWIHYGFLDYLVDEGVDFDWIGLDWYSHMDQSYGTGTEMEGQNGAGLNRALDDLTERFHKPLILCEINTWDNDSPDVVAGMGQYNIDCMELCRKKAKTNDIRGYVVYEFLDEPEKRNGTYPREGYFGLVELNDGLELVGPKPAYYELQEYLGFKGKDVKQIPLSSLDLDQFNVQTPDAGEADEPQTPPATVTPTTPTNPTTPTTPTTPSGGSVTPTPPADLETDEEPDDADEAFVPEELDPIEKTVEEHQYIERGFPVWLIIEIIAVVVLAAGAVVYVLLWRKKHGAGGADTPTAAKA